MTIMNFDLEDGLPPVSFILKPADVERFVAFMSACDKALKAERTVGDESELRLAIKAARWEHLMDVGLDGIREALDNSGNTDEFTDYIDEALTDDNW